MVKTILLTSFQTWLPHQKSNASDDLLVNIQQESKRFKQQGISLRVLRQLPVNVFTASDLAIAKITQLQPDVVICCGMAESRSQLTVEAAATPRYLVAQAYWFIYYWALQNILSMKGLTYCLPDFFGHETNLKTQVLTTSVDLEELLKGCSHTQISYDAGKFVCEGLYYYVLSYLRDYSPKTGCIFVHVPVLTPENLSSILSEFCLIMHTMAIWAKTPHQNPSRKTTTAA